MIKNCLYYLFILLCSLYLAGCGRQEVLDDDDKEYVADLDQTILRELIDVHANISYEDGWRLLGISIRDRFSSRWYKIHDQSIYDYFIVRKDSAAVRVLLEMQSDARELARLDGVDSSGALEYCAAKYNHLLKSIRGMEIQMYRSIAIRSSPNDTLRGLLFVNSSHRAYIFVEPTGMLYEPDSTNFLIGATEISRHMYYVPYSKIEAMSKDSKNWDFFESVR